MYVKGKKLTERRPKGLISQFDDLAKKKKKKKKKKRAGKENKIMYTHTHGEEGS